MHLSPIKWGLAEYNQGIRQQKSLPSGSWQTTENRGEILDTFGNSSEKKVKTLKPTHGIVDTKLELRG